MKLFSSKSSIKSQSSSSTLGRMSIDSHWGDDKNNCTIKETPFPERRPFTISSSGNLFGAVYRTSMPNSIFSTAVGRPKISLEGSPYFHEEEVVRCGYIFKRGSFWKTWKKRYFILRRDIKRLCWYDSEDKQKMKLLGSILLKPETKMTSDALMLYIQTPDRKEHLCLRCENAEVLKEWMRDINTVATSDTTMTNRWWLNI